MAARKKKMEYGFEHSVDTTGWKTSSFGRKQIVGTA